MSSYEALESVPDCTGTAVHPALLGNSVAGRDLLTALRLFPGMVPNRILGAFWLTVSSGPLILA